VVLFYVKYGILGQSILNGEILKGYLLGMTEGQKENEEEHAHGIPHPSLSESFSILQAA
jgi:hypothetical protein